MMETLTDQELEQAFQLHAPLVDRLARSLGRKLPASVDADDLIQDGRVALINAILSTYQKLTADHFRNYVALRVQGAMLDGLRAMDHGSRQLRKDMRAVEQAIQKLGHQLGRAPMEHELADALDMPLKRYQRMLQEAADYCLISLEDLGPFDDLPIPALSGEANPLAMLERASLRHLLSLALAELSEQSSVVLRHYYVDDLKMHEIGGKLGVSEARVSQIHAQAIAHLRARLVDGSGAIPTLKPRRAARAPRTTSAQTV
jgi:RNA polymerase sigma factor for flagellar operon FliA